MISIFLAIAGVALRVFLAMRRSTARLLGRAESERDALKETLDRVEKAREARMRVRDSTPDSVRDKYNRDK